MLGTSNAFGYPILSATVFLPLLGAIVAALWPARSRRGTMAVGLLTTLLVFALSAALLVGYDPHWLAGGRAAFQFADPPSAPAEWLPGGVTYQVGVDGISVVLLCLTALLSVLAMAFSWSSVREREREYVVLMLVLETGLLGVFAALDLFLFYVFWEVVLIPMTLLIALWGGAGRLYASTKFLLYTMAGSALMLVALIALRHELGADSFALVELLSRPTLAHSAQLALFAAFALAFAVKVPLVPLHTWLPDAHVEAPTAASVLLAGVLLKMGGYGFARLALPLFPTAAEAAAPALLALAVIGVWYGAAVAFAQQDVKSLVAYTSVSHMGIVMVGLLALNVHGFAGGVLQMVNHGLCTGALFLMVGMLYDRAHTRAISSFGGLWSSMPRFSAVFLVVALASIGLPGTNGFVGEWLSLLGAFERNMAVGACAAFGIVLGAVTMLWLVQRLCFGHTAEASRSLPDLSNREMAILAPIVILIFWIGLFPGGLLTPIERSGQYWITMLISLAGAGSAP